MLQSAATLPPRKGAFMTFIAIIILAGLVVGLSKGGLGAPLGALIAPMLTIVFPASEAVILALPLLIFGDWFALSAYWKAWNLRYIWQMLPTALVGIAIGTYLLVSLDNHALKIILGLFTLLFVVVRILGSRLLESRYRHHDWHNFAAGILTGLASALANAGGTPYTVYMMLQRLEPRIFVGTLTLYFAILNLLKIPGYIAAGRLQGDHLLLLVPALPLIPLGVWVGRTVVNRIDRIAFDRLLLAVLTVAAILLLIG